MFRGCIDSSKEVENRANTFTVQILLRDVVSTDNNLECAKYEVSANSIFLVTYPHNEQEFFLVNAKKHCPGLPAEQVLIFLLM